MINKKGIDQHPHLQNCHLGYLFASADLEPKGHNFLLYFTGSTELSHLMLLQDSHADTVKTDLAPENGDWKTIRLSFPFGLLRPVIFSGAMLHIVTGCNKLNPLNQL